MERGAQFVGNVGGQVAALLFSALKLTDHFVEALEQIAEHIGIVFRHARRKVACFHCIDGFEELFERTTEPHI